jgi:hypothetical protein
MQYLDKTDIRTMKQLMLNTMLSIYIFGAMSTNGRK